MTTNITNEIKNKIYKISESNHLSLYMKEIINMTYDHIQPLKIINFIFNDMLQYYNINDFNYYECKISPMQLTNLLLMENRNEISKIIMKKIFKEMVVSGNDPEYILLKNNLQQNNNKDELFNIIINILNNNKEQVEQYKSGKHKVIGFFIGKAMKETKGKANPKLVNEILTKNLNKI